MEPKSEFYCSECGIETTRSQGNEPLSPCECGANSWLPGPRPQVPPEAGDALQMPAELQFTSDPASPNYAAALADQQAFIDQIMKGTGQNIPQGVIIAESEGVENGPVTVADIEAAVEKTRNMVFYGMTLSGPAKVGNAVTRAKGAMRMELLSDVPTNRLADLTRRKAEGTLSSFEKLALLCLEGGEQGEESVRGLIDEAIETYNIGSYRVPVRVIGSTNPNASVIAAFRLDRNTQYDTEAMQQACAALDEALLKGGHRTTILIPAGMTLEFYEIAHDANVKVSAPDLNVFHSDMIQRGYEPHDFQSVPRWIVAGARTWCTFTVGEYPKSHGTWPARVLRVIPGFTATAVLEVLSNKGMDPPTTQAYRQVSLLEERTSGD